MGCFHVVCGVSKKSIKRNNKVVFIPLIANNKENFNSSFLCYPWSLFTPFFLPIKGIYNDYGYLEDIKEDTNTKLLSNKFGYSIQEIVKSIIQNKNLPKLDNCLELPTNLSGMYILEDVYNSLSIVDFNFNNNKITSVNTKEQILSYPIYGSFLELFGFSKQNSNTYIKNDISVIDNGGYCSVFNKTIWSVKEFITIWNKKTNDNLSLDSFYVDPFSLNFMKKSCLKDLENIKELEKNSYERRIFLNNLSSFLSIRDFDHLKDFYFKELSEDLIDLLLEFKYFNKSVQAGNITYTPCYFGLQEGSTAMYNYIKKSISKLGA